MTKKKWLDNNNVNFQNNINKRLKKFKIKDINKDSCDSIIKKKKYIKKFTSQQRIIKKYISDKTPYRGLLLYHGLGSGKTCGSINVAEHIDRKVVLMLPASLKDTWIGEIKKCGGKKYRLPKNFKKMDEKDKKKELKKIDKLIENKYSFVSHNAGNSAEQLKRLESQVTIRNNDDLDIIDTSMDSKYVHNKIKEIGSLDNKLLIVDEVHNLITNITNPISKNGDEIRKIIMNAKNLKILFLSGTPAISDPFELAVLFNLLRGKIKEKGDRNTYYAFPQTYSTFKDYFIKDDELINKNIFQERISGLVSYYGLRREKDDNREIYPEYVVQINNIKMSDYQWKKYSEARLIELDQEKKNKFSKKDFIKQINKKPYKESSSTYRMATRQLSNFVFPPNIERPRAKSKEESSTSYDKRINDAISSLTNKDLVDNLERYSPKMKDIVDKLNCTKKGKVFIYSEFLTLEGIGILAKVLKENGYMEYNPNSKEKTKKYKTFTIWSGSVSTEDRNKILNNFNKEKNIRGKKIRIIMATSAAAEGISLEAIRYLFIMEPYWHKNRLEQVIGRGIRRCSHAKLPKEERFVNVVIYVADPPKGTSPLKQIQEPTDTTTDRYIFNKSKVEQNLLNQFLNAMKEVAIDCELNYENNKSTMDGTCKICKESQDDLEIYPNDIDVHILPGASNCSTISSKTVDIITYKDKEYGFEPISKQIYDISITPAEIVDNKLREKILKKINK